jgi:hypothetical protein
MFINRDDLTASIIIEQLSSCKTGLILQGIDSIDIGAILNKVIIKIDRKLFVASVGYQNVSPINNAVIEHSVEKAVEWRSKKELSGSIIVFVQNEAFKLHSLREFDIITSRDLSYHLLGEAARSLTKNLPHDNFWNALQEDTSELPLEMLEDFVKSIDSDNHNLNAIPQNMWRLGLLCDESILNGNQNPHDRLRRNRMLLEEMGQLSENSRRRMGSVLAKSHGTKQSELRKAYRYLMEFYRRGKLQDLQKLSFQIVEELLNASRIKETDVIEPNPQSVTTETETTLKGKMLQERLAEYLVDSNPETEQELEELGQLVTDYIQNPQQNSNLSLGGQAIRLEKPLSGSIDLISRSCSSENWGGILESPREDLREVSRYYSPEKFHPYNPNDPSQGIAGQTLFSIIKRFDSQLGTDTFSKLLDAFANAREDLLKYLHLLLFQPLVLLGGSPDVRSKLDTYVSTYAELLHLFRQNESSLHSIDADATRYVASKFLQLDIIYVKTPTEWKAIISPLHPIHLWRFREIIRTIHSQDITLSEDEKKQLSKALPDLPHLIHFIVFTPDGTTEAITLPQAGNFETLPIYENKTNRYLGQDGVPYIQDLLSRWINFSPYSQRQIRLTLVDVPDLPIALKIIATFINQNGRRDISVVVDAYFNKTTYIGNPLGQMANIDYNEDESQLAELLRSRRINLNIHYFESIDQLVEKLIEHPSHIAYIFDQSIYRIDYSPRPRSLVISPLVVTYEYEYSEAFKRGTITPSSVAEEGLFSDYSFLVERAAHLPAGQQIRLKYGDDRTIDPINTLLRKNATKWLVLADRTLTSYAPEAAVPLGERKEGQREIAVWASANSRAVEEFLLLLAKYNLRPEEPVIQSLLNQFGHIAAGGLLSIPPGGNTINREAREKGLLGTLLAASWYVNQYPEALVASLDTSLARQWLQNRSDTANRADLIGLRWDENTNEIVIEPIEVKTRSSDIGASINGVGNGQKKLVGHAVDQLNATLSILTAIFGGTDNQPIFTRARREVLKFQLYRECFREIHNDEWQKLWYYRLKKVFDPLQNEINVRLSGIVLHIQLDENKDEHLIDQTQPIELVRIGTNTIQKLISSSKESRVEDKETITSGPEEGINTSPLQQENEKATVQVSGKYDEYKPDHSYNVSKIIDKVVEEAPDNLSRLFLRACQSYRIQVDSCDPSKAVLGPTVWRFYVKLSRGQKFSSVQSNLEDIGREMGRSELLVTKIPNSTEIALDIPRLSRSSISLKQGLEKLPSITSIEQLPIPIGVTPEGSHVNCFINDESITHLLIGGTTGSGKTIFLYGILAGLIKNHPDPTHLKLILSTSKPEDFVFFDKLPHLEQGKVITDAMEAVHLLQVYVDQILSQRADILVSAHCRSISEYNHNNSDPIPPLVVIVDEFADLTDQLAGNRQAKELFYSSIRRVAQLGRSKGIHLVLCTQRPSADLVPTNIRNLMNGRVALHVNDATASRMILEESGAEHLQLKGDLLFKQSGGLIRAQGYFISGNELDDFIKPYRHLA